MNTSEEKPASRWVIAITILSFTIIWLGSFYLAGKASVQLTSDINNSAEIVKFEKGFFYFFGIGLGFLIIVIAATYKHYIKRTISSQMDKKLEKALIFCLVIMFLIPHVVHSFTSSYLEEQGYIVCEALSTQWLRGRRIVYSRVIPCIGKEEYRRRFIEGE